MVVRVCKHFSVGQDVHEYTYSSCDIIICIILVQVDGWIVPLLNRFTILESSEVLIYFHWSCNSEYDFKETKIWIKLITIDYTIMCTPDTQQTVYSTWVIYKFVAYWIAWLYMLHTWLYHRHQILRDHTLPIGSMFMMWLVSHTHNI